MRVLWHRFLTNPRTHVLSREGETTQLKIEGLACDDVCAARSRRALSKLDGVRDVRVDLDSGIATIEGRPHEPEDYARAIDSVVTMRPLRRALERIGNMFNRRTDERGAA